MHDRSIRAEFLETRVAATRRSSFGAQPPADTYLYPVGYEPEQIRSAYGINDIYHGSKMADGAGQTIAIVDSYNDPEIFHDLNAFDKQFAVTLTGPTLFLNDSGPRELF